MNNQLTVIQRTDHFIAAVLADRTGALERALPAHVKPERFRRNLSTAVVQHPKLLDCDPAMVFNEVSKAAALGLLLDPQLGEAYLITGYSQNGPVPQLRLGYRGLMKLGRQSGEISNIYAHEVHDLDRFSITLGTEKKLIHEPNFLTERGKVILYYAVAHYRDGTSDFEPMTTAQIYAIRDRSDAWKAFKAGKIKSTPWGTDDGEMCKKTVLRRLLKRVPQSPELADALAAEDAEFVEAEPARISPPRAQIQRATTVKAEQTPAAEIALDDSQSSQSSSHGTEGNADRAPAGLDDALDDGPPPADEPAFDPLAWASDVHQHVLTLATKADVNEFWKLPDTLRKFGALDAESMGMAAQLRSAVKAHRDSLGE